VPFAEARGARLYYEVHGDGEPLLLIPGFGCTVEVYLAQTPALAKHHRVIVFDPRGAGRSDAPLNGYSMEVYAQDCVDVLRAAGVDAAHVVGTSFGGMVAQNLAIRHPQTVRRLVLGCTTPGGAQHVLPPAQNLAIFLASSEVEDPATAVRMRYPMHWSDAYIAEHDEEIVARAAKDAHLRSSAEGRAGQLAAVNGHDTWGGLPSVVAPTLVAHGAEDGVVPVENGRNIASRIPGARLSIYDAAKHMFFVERADEFNTEIVSFVSG
jgi:pimeloyl-ACP methyl ester carboxylesterase